MFVDFYSGTYNQANNSFVNGGYQGGVVENITHGNRISFDPGMRRPYVDRNGQLAVTVNTGRSTLVKGQQVPIREHRRVADLIQQGVWNGSMVNNATALRKEEWVELDRVVLRSARMRLRFWADLAAANTFGGFNGMSKMVLEHETMSDPGEAMTDMDAMTEGRNDAPKFQLEGLPLPITHADFWVSLRKLSISRNSGTPLDTNLGEACGRRVAETVEKTAIGVQTGITYGGNSTQVGGYGRTSSVYGLLNFTPRLVSVTGYQPTKNGRAGTSWVPSDTLFDVLACLDALRSNKFFGPFTVYTSNDWDQYLDRDYILTGGNVATQTLRDRLRKIDGITDVKRLDFMAATATSTNLGGSGMPDPARITSTNPFTMILVQMTPDVCRAVNGMDITTVQWESLGGMRLNFKVMCIQVPQLRADFYGNCGILQCQFTR